MSKSRLFAGTFLLMLGCAFVWAAASFESQAGSTLVISSKSIDVDLLSMRATDLPEQHFDAI